MNIVIEWLTKTNSLQSCEISKLDNESDCSWEFFVYYINMIIALFMIDHGGKIGKYYYLAKVSGCFANFAIVGNGD